MGQLTNTPRFAVTTDAGGTGSSDTVTIEGIIQGFDLIYDDSCAAGTDVYVRENNAGDILNIHEEVNNNTDKFAPPSRDTTHGNWIANGSYSVWVTGAGAAITNAVKVIARVVIA